MPNRTDTLFPYTTLFRSGVDPSEELRRELVRWVRQEIGPIASPDSVQFTPALPKTRSAKIMRRILRKIAEGDVSNLGDTSTLAEPVGVDELVTNRVGQHVAVFFSCCHVDKTCDASDGPIRTQILINIDAFCNNEK